jgi:DNA repair protein RecN (Recombination protein N)
LNVGHHARPLARIASGGELSRVMLALKTILARLDGVPTLVFRRPCAPPYSRQQG